MDANLALIGQCLLFFAVFHLIFFPAYYRDVSKVGVPFLLSSVVLGVLVIADIVLTYAQPFFRDVLDTPDPEHLGAKLLFALGCLLIYLLLTLLALRISQRRFLRLDIR